MVEGWMAGSRNDRAAQNMRAEGLARCLLLGAMPTSKPFARIASHDRDDNNDSFIDPALNDRLDDLMLARWRSVALYDFRIAGAPLGRPRRTRRNAPW
jgi:hypothetical protein